MKIIETQKYFPVVRKLLADTLTPVSVYLRLRSIFPKSVLLESSDYRGQENAWSYICFEPVVIFTADQGKVTIEYSGRGNQVFDITGSQSLSDLFNQFYTSFQVVETVEKLPVNGLFGYISFDAVSYFEKITFQTPAREEDRIPEVKYCFYRYIIAIDHHKNRIHLVENLREGESSQMDYIHHLLVNLNFTTSRFAVTGNEISHITDEEYKTMVTRGKEHCQRGDVFQVVLSRRFSQSFEGDDFNVYRALRSINPSPYLFYFDFGNYRIFGSSPEAQIRISRNKASIHPIAGTFRRTGNDDLDKVLAEKLTRDPKENAEHVMLVDLARNDLSRSCENVEVVSFREVQFYSHVIHLVSHVSGELPENTNLVCVLGESFPAGTLSGAPKHMALKLIDKYENQRRGYYGGCIGYLGFDRSVNHAIVIRSFLSINQRLFYQAGAGIVAGSSEENELQEVNNKLAALKSAIETAVFIN
jgi:anthranilate synthase component I